MKSPENEPLGKVRRRLWVLWDIVNYFRVSQLTICIMEFGTQKCEYEKLRRERGGGFQIASMDLQNTLSFMRAAELLCKEANINVAREQMSLIISHLENSADPVDVSTLLADIRNAENILMSEVWKLNFLYVSGDRGQYLDKDRLFGDQVWHNFPSARADIQQAGNCLAVECTTASVFHLMRVAEYGLRALAFDRQIVIPKKPLDLATWDEIIKKLEAEEQAIQGYAKTPARDAQFEFYHGAMMEFKRFKNKFRNRIMHARGDYDRNEALSALNHVRDFMSTLAAQIAEGKRTPKQWRGKKWIEQSS